MSANYVVIGNPIAHSKSPQIQNLFARTTGEDVCYDKLLAPLDGFAQSLHAFRAQGGQGCNVTVPFKLQAFALATRRSARAELAQAGNTIKFEADGAIFIDNTDGVGLVRDIETNAGISLRGAQVLLLGAGGAAAGALGPLIEARPQRIVVSNRSADKAIALVERHEALARACGVELQAQDAMQSTAAFDVIVNATSSSLGGQALPVGPQAIRAGTLVYDMMYGPAAEPALAWARSQGALARDGFGMLVEQAAEAFFIWRGVRPDSKALMPQLRKELVG